DRDGAGRDREVLARPGSSPAPGAGVRPRDDDGAPAAARSRPVRCEPARRPPGRGTGAARGADRPLLRPVKGLLVGLDLTEVERIAGMLERHGDRFLGRVFSPGEILRGRRHPRAFAEHVAGRFAAKEAAMKALGTGWRGVAF